MTRASLHGLGGWLRRRAENIAAAILAVMFGAFIIQIVFRYALNFPIGWTSELTVIAWLWLVLWGAAFVIREEEEIRFDLVYSSLRGRVRRIIVAITALSLLTLYTLSLPAVVDYVTFMKVQSTAYIGVRFDLLFSIYVIFVLAIIVRYLWLLWRAIAGSGEKHNTSGMDASP